MSGAFLDRERTAQLWGAVGERLRGKQDTLTGTPGQVVGFGADGRAVAVPGWSNPNLLLNWDFRNPVNRQGQTKYVGSGNTIDRWMISAGASSSLELVEGGIKFTNTATSNWFKQNIENPEDYAGSKITASALIDSVSPGTQCRVLVQLINLANNTSNFYGNYTSNGLSSVSVELPEDVKSIAVGIIINTASSWAIISSAKLELGPVQTLAYQDAAGDWVLNDPPDYDRQYARCSLYSPATGEWVGYQYSNPNLLDNWYFADPVNQRGETEYTEGGYTIDRWTTIGTVNMSLTANGIAVSSGGLAQKLENPGLYSNTKMTLSLLIHQVSGSISVAFYYANPTFQQVNVGSITSAGLHSFSFTTPDLSAAVYFGVRFYTATGTATTYTMKAVKLELGGTQTLARQDADGKWVLNDPPPNRQQELAKCQRCYQVFASEALRPTNAADFRPVMRINPTLGTINIGGKTYYTADANL